MIILCRYYDYILICKVEASKIKSERISEQIKIK